MPVRVLQMNLCDSGLAGCYTGRSVPEAAAVIRAMAPNLVTVNEVCRNDLPTLQRALIDGASASGASAVVVFVFQPALDRRTGGAYRCRNGQPYGIGLLARRPIQRNGSGCAWTTPSSWPAPRTWPTPAGRSLARSVLTCSTLPSRPHATAMRPSL
jgi:hypothetical protein